MTRDHGKGWIPDLPDIRDYPVDRLKAMVPPKATYPSIDLRGQMSPVRDQGYIGSCTGMAVAAAVEFLRRTDEDLYSTIYSPLFVYYNARKAWGWQNEDTGAYIRDAVKSVAKIGIAQESVWPYREDRYTDQPTETAQKEATRWQLGKYARATTMDEIQRALASGFPVVGGFTCYNSLYSEYTQRTGIIQEPTTGNYVIGGHAVLFVGWQPNTQRFVFKNSWGTDWGDGGYGYLPRAYIEDRRLSDDFWVLSEESEESFQGQAPETSWPHV